MRHIPTFQVEHTTLTFKVIFFPFLIAFLRLRKRNLWYFSLKGVVWLFFCRDSICQGLRSDNANCSSEILAHLWQAVHFLRPTRRLVHSSKVSWTNSFQTVSGIEFSTMNLLSTLFQCTKRSVPPLRWYGLYSKNLCRVYIETTKSYCHWWTADELKGPRFRTVVIYQHNALYCVRASVHVDIFTINSFMNSLREHSGTNRSTHHYCKRCSSSWLQKCRCRHTTLKGFHFFSARRQIYMERSFKRVYITTTSL